MKVILLEKVQGVGSADDIKDVSDGYARNFLFPRHLAVQASPKMISERDGRHRRAAKEAERDLQESQALAQRLDGIEIGIKEKANEKGLLYAAVNEVTVAKVLQDKGFAVLKSNVIMKPIKALGPFPVKLKFPHGLESIITVVVSAGK